MENTERKRIASGARWENMIGYSRAIRVGNFIEVAGTTATEGDAIIGEGDAYAQTMYVLRKIEKALIEAGSSMNDVVRSRIYTTDAKLWEEIGKAHGSFFREIRPAATLVEVSSLIKPGLLVEIEVTAITD